MGDAKVGYHTTNQTNHSPMKSDYFTKDQRNEKKNINNKTNFIAQGGDYEVSPKKFEYGAQPAKGNNDFSNVKAMITDLKGHHFTVGK